MSVVVHEPTISASTIECEVTPSRGVRRFFADDTFRAEYDADLAEVTPAVASIPVLAHVCPVAWANGADVEVPTVDRTFLEALREVRDVLVEMYTEFMDGGEVRAAEVVDTRADKSPEAYDDAALLFTGGVDSIASYVRHRDEEPALVSVQGWVVGVDEDDRWEGMRRHVEAFASQRGLETRYVRSNALSVLDMPMLQAHYKRFVDGAWYSSVGHGLGLLGLCAPLADVEGYETVHIAASHTAAFDQPWGSHPDIDDEVRWTYTEGNHDGFELTRQEKVDLIADFVETENATFPVRTCIHSETGANCNECEKCYRTMVGMVLAGLDPRQYGYEMGPQTFDEIRRAFEDRAFVLDDHTVFHWRDIQDNLSLDREFPVDGAAGFFEWLADIDVVAVAETANPPISDRVVRAVARNVPYPVYASLYPVYDAVKDGISIR
jgi:hypothetical protein